MNVHLVSIFLPGSKIRFHLDLFHTVQSYYIKFPHGFIVFRRISRCHDDPAFRNLMISEGFTLQKLQHGRSQCLRNAVDLVQKQNTLFPSCLLHLFVNRSHDLTHGIFRHRHFFAGKFFFLNIWQTDSTLAGMMGDGIGHQTDTAFLRYLLHDLGLSDTRRSDQQDRALPYRGDLIFPVLIFKQIRLYTVPDFLFCPFNVHLYSPVILPDLPASAPGGSPRAAHQYPGNVHPRKQKLYHTMAFSWEISHSRP